MKTTDIALVVFIAFISTVISFWLGGMVLGDPSERSEDVLFANGISTAIASPDIETFNPYMINPTDELIIGDCDPGQVWDEAAEKCVNLDDDGEDPDPDNPEKPDNPTPSPSPTPDD